MNTRRLMIISRLKGKKLKQPIEKKIHRIIKEMLPNVSYRNKIKYYPWNIDYEIDGDYTCSKHSCLINDAKIYLTFSTPLTFVYKKIMKYFSYSENKVQWGIEKIISYELEFNDGLYYLGNYSLLTSHLYEGFYYDVLPLDPQFEVFINHMIKRKADAFGFTISPFRIEVIPETIEVKSGITVKGNIYRGWKSGIRILDTDPETRSFIIMAGLSDFSELGYGFILENKVNI